MKDEADGYTLSINFGVIYQILLLVGIVAVVLFLIPVPYYEQETYMEWEPYYSTDSFSVPDVYVRQDCSIRVPMSLESALNAGINYVLSGDGSAIYRVCVDDVTVSSHVESVEVGKFRQVERTREVVRYSNYWMYITGQL